jgi:putative transposase
MVRAEPATGSRASPNAAYGPPKTLYNRFVRWSRMGVFARILGELAAEGREADTVMIDATHLKAHRTASSLRGKKGGLADTSAARAAG